MRGFNVHTAMLMACVALGLFVAWNVCLSQDTAAALKGGTCERVTLVIETCEAQPGRTCPESENAYRSGGTGTLCYLSTNQCISSGCVTVQDLTVIDEDE